MSAVVALDTSAAVALLVRTHVGHQPVLGALARRTAALTEHSQAETYSVLTRLPGDARLAPADAAALLERAFDAPLRLRRATVVGQPQILARLGLAGGAVYDALVGLAASEAEVPLLSRDRRALATYAAVGARVELV